MASHYWLKLYHEILHDAKMGTLSDRLWRRCIEMFLLAGDYDDEGRLPTIADMAWTLRTDADELTRELVELAGLGILSENGDRWHVTKWIERQGPVTGAERTKRHRERKRSDNYYGNESVTKRHTDTDTDVEADTEQDRDTAAEEKRAKSARAGAVSCNALQELLDLGIDAAIARKLEIEHPESFILGWCAIARERVNLNNPAGLVVKMLKDGIEPPKPKVKDWSEGKDVAWLNRETGKYEYDAA